jgi:hypothetical protein
MSHPTDQKPRAGPTPDGGYAALEFVDGTTWQAVYWPTREGYDADRYISEASDSDWSDHASYSCAGTYAEAVAEYTALIHPTDSIIR